MRLHCDSTICKATPSTSCHFLLNAHFIATKLLVPFQLQALFTVVIVRDIAAPFHMDGLLVGIIIFMLFCIVGLIYLAHLS